MSNYVIDQVTGNSYGLFEVFPPPQKRKLLVLSPNAKILEQVKKDFIKSDTEEAKKKWEKRSRKK